MSTAIDTFVYLQRDIEQSFQRVQTLINAPRYNKQEVDQVFNHISCTLDDIEKVNQLINSSSALQDEFVDTSPNQDTSNLISISGCENDFNQEKVTLISKESDATSQSVNDKMKRNFTINYSKESEQSIESFHSTINNAATNNLPSFSQRENFIHTMKSQCESLKSKLKSLKNENQMEIIQLDQGREEEDDDVNQDRFIKHQDDELEDIHRSIVSLKNLSQNMHLEIDDHIRVLENLETGMTTNQNRVQHLTHQTKNFIRSSADGVGGHTCLFVIAVVLFFLIIILILFF